MYALDVTPGETVELVFTCSRSPQTWLMTSAFASRAFRFRTMTQLIALTAFVTMGMVLLALYTISTCRSWGTSCSTSSL